MWFNYNNLNINGSLAISPAALVCHIGTETYQVSMDTSDLALGSYIINITIKIPNYESVTFSLNLTIRAKYQVRANYTHEPAQLTAGELFNITFTFEYNNDTVWTRLSGVQITMEVFINGGSSPIVTRVNTTNINGTLIFYYISIPTDTTTMEIVLQIQEGYYYNSTNIVKTDFSIDPYVGDGGGIDPQDLIFLLLLIAIAVGAVVGSVGVYRGVIVPKKREKARVLSEVKTIFDDAVSLEHILVLYKSSGMCIFRSC